MPNFLVDGALLSCPLGSAPGSLKVLAPSVSGCANPMANQMDCVPMVNIPSFGTCSATFCPCIPATAPWSSSSSVKVRGATAINESSSSMCALGGKVAVSTPGQPKVDNG